MPIMVSWHPKNLIDKPVREPDGWRATEKLYRLAAFVGWQVGRQQKNQHVKRLFFGATFCCRGEIMAKCTSIIKVTMLSPNIKSMSSTEGLPICPSSSFSQISATTYECQLESEPCARLILSHLCSFESEPPKPRSSNAPDGRSLHSYQEYMIWM